MILFFFLLIFPPVIFILIKSMIKITHRQSGFTRMILVTYLFLIFLFTVSLIGKSYNIYIKGYRSTSILFILMTFIGILYWLVDTKKIVNHLARLLLFIFTLITIPLASLLSYEVIGDYTNQLIYDNSKFRLEETGRSLMNRCTLPSLFVKHTFYEEEYKFEEAHCLTKSQIKEIEIEPASNRQIIVTYKLNSSLTNDTINLIKGIYFAK